MNIALLASGKGSNVKNILSHFHEIDDININLVATNNPNSPVIQYAKDFNVDSRLFHRKEFSKSGYLLQLVQCYNIDLVVLAGFLLMIPEEFVQNFKGSIINVHPSLLPHYGGKGMYGDRVHNAVLANKEIKSGITFHYVNENYDEGKIIKQFEVSLSEEESLNSLKKKINALEMTHFPQIISMLNDEQFQA
ncbi:MAG: formyltransferase family protein [Bacteroidota bacterium]|nr:formyltransferase family protein [Bacteroidota bacterium]MEC7937107.1 formyltransferase family protein [Bacteroidota bacterium]MEC8459924.1 formyltransferase family protein [Bacteroidota bacterium]|tara:strand:+ start:1721 stop:2296 length:576 start_codon:yes stop_codon:yes gene_type:complete